MQDGVYAYDPGRNRWKHKTKKGDTARIERRPGGLQVGICPKGLGPKTARALLAKGCAHKPAGWSEGHPKAIFAVYEGVSYEAVITLPGRSYHGFPCNRARIPPSVRFELQQQAERQGEWEDLRKWWKNNP